MSCVWVRDAEGRNYILPERGYERLCKKGMVLLPTGKAVLVTRDKKAIFIDKQARYPADMQAIFERIRELRFREVQQSVAEIKEKNNAIYLRRLVTDRLGRADDIWTKVISYLDPSAVVCLFLATKFFHPLLKPDFKNFSLNCVKDGHLNLFQWSKFPKPQNKGILCEEAAKKGHLEIYQLLWRKKYPLGRSIYYAAVNGHDEFVLKMPFHPGMICEHVFAHYAKIGNVKMFSWCASNRYSLGPSIAFYAAMGGSIEILKIVRQRECISHGNVLKGAVRGGHIKVLEWLKSFNYPKSDKAIRYAEKENKPDIVEWLKNNGFPG